jgi:hypothetical protein
MADTPVLVHQSENSHEYVAYQLLETIALAEKKA